MFKIPLMFNTALLAIVNVPPPERPPPLLQLSVPLTVNEPVSVDPLKFKMPSVPTVPPFVNVSVLPFTLSV